MSEELSSTQVIIYVEDSKQYWGQFEYGLEDLGYEIVFCEDLEGAKKAIKENAATAIAVFLDGYLRPRRLSEPPHTLPLIGFCKEHSPGVAIVAISSEEETNELMMKEGCTHSTLKKRGWPWHNKLPDLMKEIEKSRA